MTGPNSVGTWSK